MEWEPQQYGKLLKEYDTKIAILNHKRIESDGRRHDLYRKKDSGTKLTSAEDAEIDERCEFENGIVADSNHLYELLNNIYKAMDDLKEELENHSDKL